MPEVIIHDDESFERALKRFKKKCEKAGILSDLRKHRHYEKPSERKKRKMNAARRKNRRTRRAAIAAGAKDLGKLMGQVMPQVKGRADGKLVNQIAREELAATV